VQVTRIILILTVIAAISGSVTLKVTARHIDIGGILSGAAFVLALVGGIYLLQVRPERAWYDGRAVAESARTLAWLYAVGGGAFSVTTCRHPDVDLLDRLSRIAEQLRRLALPVMTHQITDNMRAVRASSFAVRKQVYISGRIKVELEWYTRKAEWNARQENIWRGITLSLQGLGLIAAIARITGWLTFDLLGVIAAGVAAAAAWLAAKDHGTLAEAYSVTALDLSLARDRAVQITDDISEYDWSQFVETAERAISREHTLWLARGGIQWK
jgi:hypothetical protein